MASRRPADLPDFQRPPINEVLLSIQFASLPFRTFHSGTLLKEFVDHPIVSEHSALPPTFETFGTAANPQGSPFPFSLEMVETIIPRYWMQSNDLSDLLQFQPDRIVQNWLKKPDAPDYPRYEQFREQFWTRVHKVNGFLDREKIGKIVPNQCEVTYVNHIDLPDKQIDPRMHLEKIFRVWSNEYADDQGRKIESANIQFRYVLSDENDEPYGRLYATIQPATRPDGQPIVQFTLTARGRPKTDTIESAFDFLDSGRNAVVRAFSSMTRPEMQDLWERKNV